MKRKTDWDGTQLNAWTSISYPKSTILNSLDEQCLNLIWRSIWNECIDFLEKPL